MFYEDGGGIVYSFNFGWWSPTHLMDLEEISHPNKNQDYHCNQHTTLTSCT